MKVALIQFNASADKKDNIRRSKSFVQEAIAQKAQWILLPETFSLRADIRNEKIRLQEREKIPGETTKEFLKLAHTHKIDLLLGSLFEQAPGTKLYNTSVALNSSSGRVKKYRKIHLFEAILGDKILRESQCMTAGKNLTVISVAEFKVGLSICYDLRFPDLYQKYARRGVHVLTVPSCFTQQTGQAHWETLLRARAIENLCYVLAPNQVGTDARGVEAFGNSMIVGPWGEIIARASSNKEEIIYGEISLKNVKEARAKLPGIIKG